MTPILLVFQIVLLPVYLQVDIEVGDVSQLVDPTSFPSMPSVGWSSHHWFWPGWFILDRHYCAHLLGSTSSVSCNHRHCLLSWLLLRPESVNTKSSALRASIYLFAPSSLCDGVPTRGSASHDVRVCHFPLHRNSHHLATCLRLAADLILPAVILMQTIIFVLPPSWIPGWLLVQTGVDRHR